MWANAQKKRHPNRCALEKKEGAVGARGERSHRWEARDPRVEVGLRPHEVQSGGRQRRRWRERESRWVSHLVDGGEEREMKEKKRKTETERGGGFVGKVLVREDAAGVSTFVRAAGPLSGELRRWSSDMQPHTPVHTRAHTHTPVHTCNP